MSRFGKRAAALRAVMLIGCFALATASALAQSVALKLYDGMRWRCIGPYRAGRTVAAVGVPSHPGVFYIGAVNGGVWKSDDYGRTWDPLFDKEDTGSIGAIAVAPSDSNRIYVGSGEGLQRPDLSVGDGIYRSDDGGQSWKHLGLRDSQQITAIAVDPNEENTLFVAVLGHPYGPNTQRGIFRSTDGGRTWQRVLYLNADTGAATVELDPSNSHKVYAVLWQARQGPWENGEWNGPDSGLYVSVDSGDHWQKIGAGLPTFAQGLGRIGIAIAPSDPRRMYAMVQSRQMGGVYRSDDAGATWRIVDQEHRVYGRGDDFAEVEVDPRDENRIYVANTSTYLSTDAGNSFTAFKGSPGGDDYHRLWIDPIDPSVILLAGDQGAAVTVNRGRTWSSWYNQPTAEFYHVVTDNRFPYWVYGGQQESGSAGVCSRGNDGQVTMREWHPVGAEEYAYIAPDPLNPRWIYGGKVSKFDWVTGQVQDVGPVAPAGRHYRFLRTAPLEFSPVDPHALYLGANVLLKTTDGGDHWQQISPDLTHKHPEVPPSVGVYRTTAMAKMPRRGVIYALGLSHVDAKVIWAGTDDGLVHVTRDGGSTWENVTPPGMTSWSKVAGIDAGRFDAGTAYVAVNRLRCDDLKPYLYATHDFGKTWTKIDSTLPQDSPTNAIREDPVRQGLLYCATEHAVFFSIDDGQHWNPLRLNMPATSIRDIVVHGNDLVAGTHGRGFWILDDITPLRTIEPTAHALAVLYAPETAMRIKRDTNSDTPLPPEEPAGQNPPNGAIIDYYLAQRPQDPVILSIVDANGKMVRRFSSNDQPRKVDPKSLDVPMYWVKPARTLSGRPGFHRFVWGLHLAPPKSSFTYLSMGAIVHDTPPGPLGPAILPGKYTVHLTVDGRDYGEPLTVVMDPRVAATAGDLKAQYRLSLKLVSSLTKIAATVRDMQAVKMRIDSASLGAGAGEATAIRQIDALMGGSFFGGGPPGLGSVSGEMSFTMATIQGADAAPTAGQTQSVLHMIAEAKALEGRWAKLKAKLER